MTQMPLPLACLIFCVLAASSHLALAHRGIRGFFGTTSTLMGCFFSNCPQASGRRKGFWAFLDSLPSKPGKMGNSFSPSLVLRFPAHCLSSMAMPPPSGESWKRSEVGRFPFRSPAPGRRKGRRGLPGSCWAPGELTSRCLHQFPFSP